jgi:peptidoglycan/xylan/chitin deacetylase (PgdA/CDA1 family)
MERMQFLTSWDDGYLLDLKVADLLDRYGMKGTFYLCPAAQHAADMLSKEQIKALSSRHAIGAHSMTHPKLTKIPAEQAAREIRDSKKWVEDATGKPCTMFCYPYGAVNDAVKKFVREAGFTEARITDDLEFSAPDPFLQPVSLQVMPFPVRHHSRIDWKILDHFGPLRSRYAQLRKIKTPHSAMTSWLSLAKYLYGYAKETDQTFFHLYGHSREVEKYGMWGDLEEFLAYVGGYGKK